MAIRRWSVGRWLSAGFLLAVVPFVASNVLAQVPRVFQPNAGTILNMNPPPLDAPELPSIKLPAPVEVTPEAVPDSTRVKVTGFAFDNNTLFKTEQLQAPLMDLVGRELSLSELRQAAARITALYRDSGYFLARAYLPAQDVSGGVIRIAVLEGRFDRVEANGSPRLEPAVAQGVLAAQGVAPGQPVERTRLERSLILLEQKAGAPTQAVLQPGATVGTSALEVDTPSAPLFGGSLGLDNYGSYFTGQTRATASLHLNSPLRIGDRANLWLMHSSGADAVFASYQVPVGYDGLTLGANYSQYNYALCCQFAPLERTGEATVAGLLARYPFQLSQQSVVYGGLSLDRKHLSDYAIVGNLDDKWLNVVSLSVEGVTAALNGQNRYRMALVSGDLSLSGNPASAAINAATVDTAGRYTRFRGEWDYLHPLQGGSLLNLRVSGQVASRNLDSSEKFLLGGYSGVRAYPEGEAGGDNAWLARLDWVYPMALAALPGKLALRAFVDSGAIWVNDDTRGGLAATGVPNHYVLSGGGVGLNWSYAPGISAGLYVATKIGSNPGRSTYGYDADGRDSQTRGWLGIEWAF